MMVVLLLHIMIIVVLSLRSLLHKYKWRLRLFRN